MSSSLPTYLEANKGPEIIAIIRVFPCLAFLVVGLRLYTQFAVIKIPSYEDLTIVLALVWKSHPLVWSVDLLTLSDIQHCNLDMSGLP